MNLTPEEQAVGKENYYEAMGVTRRDFLKGAIDLRKKTDRRPNRHREVLGFPALRTPLLASHG